MTARVSHLAPSALFREALKLYDSGGYPAGSKTGWSSLDPLYSVALGQWTVITGFPGSGKSEWLDALLVNLAEADPDWNFAVYSPENYPPATHLAKLTEKRGRGPFHAGLHPRMSRSEMADAALWINSHFLWLDTDLKTPDELVARALEYADGHKLGVVLDPWNTLDHQRSGMSETDYVSYILTEVTNMCRTANAHVWLVVHPAKMFRDKDGKRPIPTPYDISGSAHWYNKADNIITVHRDQNPDIPTQAVDLHVQKIRHKHSGRIGMATLFYDKVTGRYFDPPSHPAAGVLYSDPERNKVPPKDREPGQD